MEEALKAAMLGRAREAERPAALDFDRLVREHQQRVYRVLLGLLREPDAAATLTQECFLRAFQKQAGYRGEAAVGTWLVSIAINLARDHARSRRGGFWRRLLGSAGEEAAAALAATPSPGPSPEQALLAREEVAAVWRAVEELSAQQREVFLLRFAEEMPLEEIGQALGLELGTVKSHLFRAVTRVRQRTKEQYGGNPSQRR